MSVLAIDIGGTNLRIAEFKSPRVQSTLTQEKYKESDRNFSVSHFIDVIDRALKAHKIGIHEISAIGISVAGVVNPDTGVVYRALNIGWENVPLASIISEKFSLPVNVDTDAFCGTIAEKQLGSAQELNSFLYVVIGTGIGHGLFLGGKVWRGVHGAASVFGHLKVMPEGHPCYCGGKGCVCQYASGEGIALLGNTHTGPGSENMTGKEIVLAAASGSAQACKILDEATERLAFGLSSAYTLLDIETTILGGGVVSSCWPDLAALKEKVEKLVYPEIRPIDLRRSQLGSEAIIKGAALLGFELIQTAKE